MLPVVVQLTGAYCLTEQKTVEFSQLQCSRETMSLLCRSSSGSRGRGLKLSSSPEFVDLPVCNEMMGFQRGFGGDAGVGFFRAPPGCPGVERQFSEFFESLWTIFAHFYVAVNSNPEAFRLRSRRMESVHSRCFWLLLLSALFAL